MYQSTRETARLYHASSMQSVFHPSLGIADVSIVSQATGKDSISQPSEALTITAIVKSLSVSSVSGISATLSLIGDETAISIDTANVMVRDGSLAARDDAPLTGEDQAQVAWTVHWDDAVFRGQPLILQLDLLQDGNEPVSFDSDAEFIVLPFDDAAVDPDGDALPTDWELDNGLLPDLNDAHQDPDEDGIDNLAEYDAGTDPQESDTDGDGLSDGEELSLGADGYITDPLKPDTDDDGYNDLEDSSPDNALSIDTITNISEPVVEVSNNRVHIVTLGSTASVVISNIGTGSLSWIAEIGDPAIASVLSSTGRAGDTLVIGAASTINPSFVHGIHTQVIVSDTGGAVRDTKAIDVIMGEAQVDVCGNGLLDPGESCDDFNMNDNDGCSSECMIEEGWICENIGQPCTEEDATPPEITITLGSQDPTNTNPSESTTATVGDVHVVILQFEVNNAVETWIGGLTLQIDGSGDNPGDDIQQVELYQDVNQDGIVDAGDTLIDQDRFSNSNDKLQFVFGRPYNVPAGKTVFLVSADL